MNTAVQLSEIAMLAPAARSAPQASLDVARAEDVYALWKEAFEHMRAVEVPHDEPAPSAAQARELSNDFAARDPERYSPSVDFIEQAGPATLAIPPIIRTVAAASHCADGAQTDLAASRGIGSNPSPVAQLPMSIRHRASAPASKCDGHITSNAAPALSAASEAVSVFVRGAAVTIVIRDAALSAHDALHGAFETARELTGQRAALRHLRLNGRTLYQHGDHSTRAGSMLVFAC